ncbi:MAG TPA: hypothetical protein VF432_04030 [Thermoanaerobaculia bacterium]
MRSRWFVALAFLPLLASGEPVIRLSTAPAGSAVTIAADGASLSHELVLEATKDTRNIRIEKTKLMPGGITVVCTVNGKDCSVPFAMKAFTSQVVQLRVNDLAPGSYAGTVSIVTAAARDNIALAVTRAAPSIPLQLVSLAKAAGKRGDALTIDVALQSAATKTFTADAPALVLVRKAPGALGDVQATPDVTWQVDGEDVGKTWEVRSNGSHTLRAKLTKLDAPGEYRGTVRVSAADAPKPFTAPVSIWIKYDWQLPAFLIALGSLLSYGLGLYVNSLRPALMHYSNAALLTTDVDDVRTQLRERFGAEDPADKRVLDRLLDRLTKLAKRLELGQAADAEATLSDVDDKLSMIIDWTNVRRRAALLPDDTRKPFDDRIAVITAVLESSTTTGVADAKTDLSKLHDEIEDAIRDDLKKRTEALGKELAGSQLLDPAAKQSLAALVAKVADRETLREAELAYADAIGKAFRARLAAATVRPIGFVDDAAWSTLKTRVQGMLDAGAGEADPAKRAAAYREAFIEYTRETLRVLHEYASERPALIDKNQQLAEEQKAALKERAEAIVTELDAAQADLDAGKADAASAKTNDAAAKLVQWRSDVSAASGQTMNKAEEAAAEPPPLAAIDFTGAFFRFLGLDPRKRRLDGETAHRIRGLVTNVDFFVLLIALLVAILLGLRLLWFDDPDWGSGNDMIVAVLWGLGLHQVTSSGLQGFADLRAKLGFK